MSLGDDLRLETVSMNDVADLFDLFSDPLSWTPTFAVTSPMTISSTSILTAIYYEVGDLNIFFLHFTATVGGTSRYEVKASLPFTPIASTYHPLTCIVGQPNSGSYKGGLSYTDGTDLICRYDDTAEMTADTIDINISGIIRL